MRNDKAPRIIGLCLGLVLAAIWPAGPAFAASPCKFAKGTAGFGAKGNSAALIAGGRVDATTPAVYQTKYVVDVGIWVDADLAALDPNMPALALAYFEHANCIFALGSNATTTLGVHDMSLRISGNQILYFKRTSPKVNSSAYWVQQTHQDWAKAIAALGAAAPKLNLLFTASNYVEIGTLGAGGGVATWTPIGGASNGVGQGQALAAIDPAAFKNGAKPFNEDWWGVIAAHEIGHALGVGLHLPLKYDNMCCLAPTSYSTEIGTKESYQFSMSLATWGLILANDAATTDNYADPYVTTPNPVTNQKWSFPQIHKFLGAPGGAGGSGPVIWGHTGASCTATACPGWQPLDSNAGAVAIAAADANLYQLHASGAIWRYTGTPCSGATCTGWQKLDQNPNARAIAAGGANLYQLHGDGSLWRYTGTPCTATACPGWQKIDHNTAIKSVVAAGANLYTLHSTGAIWRYTGTPCTATSCPGWQKLDQNAATVIAAADANLYQLHAGGAIWRYTGTPCTATSCPGWQKLDQNAATAIAAGGGSLYQLHGDGSIWRYTGTPCTATACPGWQKLDQNTATAITASGANLYQLHGDGSIWRYTGTPCTATTCPGWQKLDQNPRTKSISAGTTLYQLHRN